MRIAWTNDIHLNTVSQRAAYEFCARLAKSRAELLLIGGDIAEATDLGESLLFLQQSIERPIYFVLGNHDYYGSDVASVRSGVRALAIERLHWLPATGCVELTPRTALVGHGGWGDARLGNVDTSPVMLTDFLAIRDLVQCIDREDFLNGFRDRSRFKAKLRELGDDAARELAVQLSTAMERYERIIVLTHVPPFKEAAWHEGKLSGEDWLPYFTCKAVGDLLMAAARSAPGRELTVLCGHTHGGGELIIQPNLHVFTGAAEYGSVDFQVMEIP